MKRTVHVRSEADRDRLAAWVGRIDIEQTPLTFTYKPYKRDRSLEQNALSHAVYKTVADQLGDRTPEEVRCEAKLRYGVPILRAADPEYCALYDEAIKPMDYETKLKAIRLWPVTRLMTVDQMQQYLDTVMTEYAKQGVFFDSQ